MPAKQTTQASSSNSTQGMPTGEQARALEDVARVRQTINQIQTSNQGRSEEAAEYMALASSLDSLGNIAEADLAQAMAELCDIRQGRHLLSPSLPFDKVHYDRLLWFSNSWSQIEPLLAAGRATEAHDLLKNLIHCQQAFEYSKFSSHLWRKRARCESILGLGTESKESEVTASMCERREQARQAAMATEGRQRA